MPGVLWYLYFQVYGQLLARRCFQSLAGFERLLLGSVCGSVAAIWLPIPFSFLFGFNLKSHLFALACSLFSLVFLIGKQPAIAGDELRRSLRRHRAFFFFLLPFLACSVLILLSHTLQQKNGALYTGQCGWGDMPMHLGFITSIVVQGYFPPEYSILPGERLCYPFLCDSVSSSLYLLGTPLRWAYMLPVLFALIQVFCGFYLFACAVLKSRSASLLAFVFFFLNGGLGSIYFLNKYTLKELFTGFYKTPTNLSAEGIRWVNVIADMLIPQRATLFGWAVLFPVLLLLFLAVFRDRRQLFLPAGILAGLLPMIHTHSYLALGLVAACWMISDAAHNGLSGSWLRCWLSFGLPAVLLAVPQLLLWTFHSVEGNEQFLRFHFDWVNEGKENWLWFWLKNVGPLFLIGPLSLALSKKEQRAALFPALLIFLLCELVAFQPNVYDNNKLFYISHAFFCLAAADGTLRADKHIKGKSLRAAALTLLILLCTNAAVLTLTREIVSGTGSYSIRLFSASDARAAEYIRDNTEPDALFLTASNHNNAVAALTGRSIFCGSSSYLFYHGLNYRDRLEQEKLLLTDGEYFESMREELGVDYVYLGDYERGLTGCDTAWFDAHYPKVYSYGGVSIYKTS